MRESKGQFISFMAVGFFLAAWEIVSSLDIISKSLISSPTAVIFKTAASIQDGLLAENISASLIVLFLGLSTSIVAGVFIGLFMYYDKKIFQALKPFVFGLNSVPAIAILPLLTIWLGIGFATKIAMVVYIVFPLVAINTYEGVLATDENLIKMGVSFGASKIKIMTSIVFWSVLPNIFASIKISIGRSIVGLLIAEMYGFGKGLGYLLSFFGTTGNATGLMMIACTLLILNYLLIKTTNQLEKRLVIR